MNQIGLKVNALNQMCENEQFQESKKKRREIVRYDFLQYLLIAVPLVSKIEQVLSAKVRRNSHLSASTDLFPLCPVCLFMDCNAYETSLQNTALKTY